MTYFFHIRNVELIEDLEGSELGDLSAVRAEAHVAARELLRDGLRNGAERRNWRIEVADPSGRIVLDMSLGEAADLRPT